MIFLVNGDDLPAIRNYIKFVRKHFTPENIYEYENDNIDISDIESIADTYGMFGDKKLVIMYPKKLEQIEFSDQFLTKISTDKEMVIVIDTKSLSKVSKNYKKLKKHSDEKKFQKNRDYTNFNISDAIYVEGNIKKAMTLISGVDDLENEFFGIIGTLQGSLRNFLSYKYKNESYKKLHPFVKKKVVMMRVDINKVPQLYKKLLEIDKLSKTTNKDKKVLLQDFVIYFFC